MELAARIFVVAVLAQVITAIPHERASVKTLDSEHRVRTARRAPTDYFKQERNAVYNVLFGPSVYNKVMQERSPAYNKVMQERSPAYNKVMHERSPAHNKVMHERSSAHNKVMHQQSPSHNKFMHERSPVHERQVTQSPDEEAASIISMLVTQYHQYLFGHGMNSTEFVAFMDFLTGLQLEDPASIEPVMHDLLDSQFLQSVFVTFEQHGWVKNAVKTLYRYITFQLIEHRIGLEYTMYFYNNCQQQDWCADGIPELLISALHLIDTVESIGLMSQDIEGTITMNDMIGRDHPWFPEFSERMEENLNNLDNFHSATSDQEQEQHCTELTQAVRKLWSDLITDVTQYDPEASQNYPETVLDWTGITVSNNEDIKNLICEFIGRMRWSGFDGLYTTLLDRDILWSAIEHGYPLVTERVNNEDQILEDMLSQYSELDPDAPPNVSGQVTAFKLAKTLIDILRHDMGLLDLIQDV